MCEWVCVGLMVSVVHWWHCCTVTPAMTRGRLVASYRLSPVEAATAASQVELTLPPHPHLCSACSPPASHTSAGYVLQPQADLIYHVTNGTKHRRIHTDPVGLLGETKHKLCSPSGLNCSFITSMMSRSQFMIEIPMSVLSLLSMCL